MSNYRFPVPHSLATATVDAPSTGYYEMAPWEERRRPNSRGARLFVVLFSAFITRVVSLLFPG